MGEQTKIAWTSRTWNPWQGCHKVSPGCRNCYMYSEKIRYGQRPNVVVRSKPPTFNAPLKWTEPAFVFACSWSDWFIEEADAWRDEAWDIVRRTPHLTYQILTKRPERIATHLPADWGSGWANVWLGVSIEDQPTCDERLWRLAGVEAAVRFISVEPQLAFINPRFAARRRDGMPVPLDGPYAPPHEGPRVEGIGAPALRGARIGWVIVGGESGPRARPFDLAWVRWWRDRCRDAGVPVFVKQMGARSVNSSEDLGPWPVAPATEIRWRDPKGADPAEWPADLRVQEWPEPPRARNEAATEARHG
jgi:protein gp37